MSSASIGYLANISVSDTQGGTYTALVSEPTMVSVPSTEVSRIEATHLQSPGRSKEYVPGLKDPSAVSYEANYVKTDFVALKTIEGLVKWFRVTSGDPDGAGPMAAMTATFPGYLHKLEIEFQPEDLNKMKWEIQTTGDVTIA
jgi:hypothetical protein